MNEEMYAILSRQTWELVLGLPVVSCRSVFKVKCRPDGTMDSYKVRLVAKVLFRPTKKTICRPLLLLISISFVLCSLCMLISSGRISALCEEHLIV